MIGILIKHLLTVVTHNKEIENRVLDNDDILITNARISITIITVDS